MGASWDWGSIQSCCLSVEKIGGRQVQALSAICAATQWCGHLCFSWHILSGLHLRYCISWRAVWGGGGGDDFGFCASGRCSASQ